MPEKKWTEPYSLTLGALLAALTIMTQMAPLYLPVVGVSLSALGTLPVACAAFYHPVTGLLTYIVSALLIASRGIFAALSFLCGAGLLGLCLGYTMRSNAPLTLVLGFSASFLTLGVLAAGWFLGLPVLPWLTGTARKLLGTLVFLYALVYTALWVPVLAAVLAKLKNHLPR